jgi:hypothetical protein
LPLKIFARGKSVIIHRHKIFSSFDVIIKNRGRWQWNILAFVGCGTAALRHPFHRLEAKAHFARLVALALSKALSRHSPTTELLLEIRQWF